MTKTMTLLALSTALALPQLAAAQDITEFRIGVLGGENAQERMTNNECLRKQTEELLGVPVRLFTPADYDGVIQGLLGGTLDAAILGASGYAKAYLTDPEAVEPVLVKTNLDGSSTYYSVGFARKDRNVKSLDDLKGKVLGFGDPNSTSGYLIPAVEMPAAGYSMEPGQFFGEIKFTGGHEQTIVAVQNGDIDAGVTWADGLGNWEDGYNSGALRKAVDAGIVDMNDMVEIWRSKPIAEGPLVVRKALPAEVKAKFTKMMQDMINTDKECTYGVAGGETAGFMPVAHENYLSIIEARKLEEAKGS